MFRAYYAARKHKRRSAGALAFEMHYESELFALHKELVSGRYVIGPSACFISFHPVQREIFAAGFRDRIVHHVIYNAINPVFERLFINDSYSCRTGKGTSYGIRRVDHFITCRLGCQYYGRYVDDMVIVHHDKEYLKSLIPIIRSYLCDTLFLEVHPRKIYLQPVSHGVPFLGTVIKPYRIYMGRRIKGSCAKRVRLWNEFLAKQKGTPSTQELERFLSSINSYLGCMKRYRTYRLRKKILTESLAHGWRIFIRLADDFSVVFVR